MELLLLGLVAAVVWKLYKLRRSPHDALLRSVTLCLVCATLFELVEEGEGLLDDIASSADRSDKVRRQTSKASGVTPPAFWPARHPSRPPNSAAASRRSRLGAAEPDAPACGSPSRTERRGTNPRRTA
ncbi:hypothetical protein EAO74_06990 [Streptomyces sp. gb1(2016)]|uniref:Uncharacterized protein n=1 Tax=Streptomyces sp. gb1(2016) TaxID=1828321 RepID=A0A652LB62_9ACTN|nr:hypothetical protein EAO74_06990 [Streptomyces sp. gb1(2016)]